MKSIKKILAAVMATAVVGAACMIPTSAAAAPATFAVEQKTITVDEAADEVVVSFMYTGTTEINSTAFDFYFDDRLTLTYVDSGSVTKSLGATFAGNEAGSPEAGASASISAGTASTTVGKAAVALSATKRVNGIGAGEIVTLYFEIAEDAQVAGEKFYINAVNYNPVVSQPFGGEQTELTPSFTEGWIEIEGVEETTTTPEVTTTVTTTTTPAPTTTVTTTTTPTPTTTTETTTDDEGLGSASQTSPEAAITVTTTEEVVEETTAKKQDSSSKGGTTTSKTPASPTTGDTSSAAGMLAVLGLAGAAAIATKKKNNK